MKRLLLIIAVVAWLLPCGAASLTAAQVMNKCAATVRGGDKGTTVKFTAKGKQAVRGILVTSGKRFYLDLGGSRIWYNGREMATYSAQTREVTLALPSAAEVNQTNPLSYVAAWGNDYTASFASTQSKSQYCVVLTSKRSAAAAKKAVVMVNKSNFRPSKIVISLKSGETLSVAINSITAGGAGSANGFTFPRKSYPNVTVNDLR